jgi:hypothetical protein
MHPNSNVDPVEPPSRRKNDTHPGTRGRANTQTQISVLVGSSSSCEGVAVHGTCDIPNGKTNKKRVGPLLWTPPRPYCSLHTERLWEQIASVDSLFGEETLMAGQVSSYNYPCTAPSGRPRPARKQLKHMVCTSTKNTSALQSQSALGLEINLQLP